MYPILYKIGPLPLYAYGLFLALGFLAAIFMSGREARRLGLSVGGFYDLCFYSILSALVGSRILFVLRNYEIFFQQPQRILALWDGGLDFFGGLLVAVPVAFFYMRRRGLPWRASFDALAVGMPLGQSLGRVGCFMAGCCWGSPTDLPWAVRFTRPDTLCTTELRGIPLHPTQLYESLLYLLVFVVVFGVRKRKRFDGQLMLLYFFLANLARFAVEFVRSPLDERGLVFSFPMTQVVALGIALLSGALLWWGWRRSGTSGAN